LEPTGTNAPASTRTPTAKHTTTVNYTPTPHQVATQPEGQWCEKNTVREICVYEIAYFIETLEDPSLPGSTQFAVIDVFVENLSSYAILIDPYNFTLILEDGTFSFLFDDPEELFEDIDEIRFTSIAPGENIRGTLRFMLPENTLPETLTHQGYLYESVISIDINDAR
jgi:hypothetical protein